MKIVGILTEFNPFHSGHAYFLSEVRRRVGVECALMCVMSGNFVQRGEPAMLEKHVRAEAALRCGADLILELPVARALSSAEGFACGGVFLMQAAGADVLAFGSECGDAAALERVAAYLDSEAYREGLRYYLNAGLPFAACRQAAVRDILGEDAAALLDSANNNLGVEYLKAARRLGWDCQVVTVPRRGAGHDSNVAGEYLSASALRQKMAAGEWEAVRTAVPEASADLYRNAFDMGSAPVTVAGAERMIQARLRTMTEEAFAALPDCGEGLHRRLYKAARSARSLEELLSMVKTKRYAHARLRRIVMCAWLGIDAASSAELPAYLRVLGCNERGRAVLARLRDASELPVLVKPADVRNLSAAAQKQFEREARATELYSLAYPSLEQAVPGAEWRTGPVVLNERKQG